MSLPRIAVAILFLGAVAGVVTAIVFTTSTPTPIGRATGDPLPKEREGRPADPALPSAAALSADRVETSLEPTPERDDSASREASSSAAKGVGLDFVPTKAQVDQLRKLDPAELRAFARQLSFRIGTETLPDARVRARVESRLSETQADLDDALNLVYSTTNTAFEQATRSAAAGLGLPRPTSESAVAIAEANRTLPDGTTVHVVVRTGDFPKLDEAREAYLNLCRVRFEMVVAVFDAVTASRGGPR